MTFMFAVIDNHRQKPWLSSISPHEWTTLFTETLVVAFVAYTTITQQTTNNVQTSDSINYFVAKKPCNWNI